MAVVPRISLSEWIARCGHNPQHKQCSDIVCEECPLMIECSKLTWIMDDKGNMLSQYQVAENLYQKYKISEKLKWL